MAEDNGKVEEPAAAAQGTTKFEELHDAAPVAKFRFSVAGKIGVAIVAFWVFVALAGPFIAPYDENDLPHPDAYSEYQPVTDKAWLGTDVQDRDVLSRIMFGASRTMGISFTATILAYIVGVTLGIAAAVSGRWIDSLLSRINDAFLSLPTIMLGLVVVAAVGSSIPVLIGTAGLIFATGVFRISRSLALDIMVQDFVEAAHARGEGLWWIISREIWPNAAMPLISDFGLRLIFVVLFTAGLSFLGLGVQPPQADWGNMVRENLGAFVSDEASKLSVLGPALSIASLTISINLIVDDVSAFAGGKLSKGM
jgi:peptide/nickel transport system permease protein